MKSSFVNASAAKQPGFGMLELMLAAMIAAGITLGYLYNQSRQSAISQAQSQAGYYQMVSDAVAKYMANNYEELTVIFKTRRNDCSNLQLVTDTVASTAPTAPTDCRMRAAYFSGVNTKHVANGMQPTLAELKETGYLDANFSNSFLWSTQLTMYDASDVQSGSTYAAPEYRVQIQAWCKGAASTSYTYCSDPVLTSLVYNAQPFAANTDNSFINFSRLDRLMQARTALGANAFISYDWALKKDAFLYSDGNKSQVLNPLKFSSGSEAGVGVEGVLALQAQVTSSSQTTSSRPPPAPIPEIADLPGAKPYSECDPTKDTFAFANQENSRVVPLGVIDTTTTNRLCRRETSQGNTPYYAYVVPSGQALACKPNLKAVSYLYSTHVCPIPDNWKTCVTSINNGSSGYTDPQYSYITISPADGNQAYCWQPSPDIYRVPLTTQYGFVKNIEWSEYFCVSCGSGSLLNATWSSWASSQNCIPPKCQAIPSHTWYGYR